MVAIPFCRGARQFAVGKLSNNREDIIEELGLTYSSKNLYF